MELEKATLEKKLEHLNHCIVCKEPKIDGLIVCWNCFKHRKDIIPLKEYCGTLEAWLKLECKIEVN